jgi:hypothetical protein
LLTYPDLRRNSLQVNEKGTRSAQSRSEASLARGEGLPITPESMRDLADEVQQRGRARARFDSQQRVNFH